MTEICNLLIQDGNFIQTIAKQVITLIDLDTLLQSITELIVTGAITLVDPDGNSIAASDGNGHLIVHAATKERYGIVKLQDGSGGQGGTQLDKMVAAPDRSIIGIKVRAAIQPTVIVLYEGNHFEQTLSIQTGGGWSISGVDTAKYQATRTEGTGDAVITITKAPAFTEPGNHACTFSITVDGAVQSVTNIQVYILIRNGLSATHHGTKVTGWNVCTVPLTKQPRWR